MARSWWIGSGPEVDVLISAVGVSGRHAELGFLNGGWCLRDLHSTNGTFLNGRQVGAEWCPVQPDDVASFGPHAQRRIADLIGALNDPTLAVRLVLGSSAECDLVIDHPAVSGQHAELLIAGERWVLSDQDSTNGTWLDGERVERSTWPPDGDVHLGTARLGRGAVDALLRSMRAVGDGEWTLGADASCTLVLDRVGVSGHHVGLRVVRGGMSLRDLNSSNGTRVDDVPIGGAWRPVADESVVEIGPWRTTAGQLRLSVGQTGSRAGLATDGPPALAPSRAWWVGSGDAVDLLVKGEGVSGRHAELSFRGGGWHVRDLGSSNGTYVEGAKVGTAWQAVRQGDSISFGAKARHRVSELLERLDDPVLVLRLTVGSAPDNDIVLPFASVSAHHAYVLVAGERRVVVDRASTNGVWLDGERVERATWSPGANVRVASVELPAELVAAALQKLSRVRDGSWRFGSDASCDLVIDREGVSHHHGDFKAAHGAWFVRDNGSSNGTWCDGAPVGASWVAWTDGSLLRLGAWTTTGAQVRLAVGRRVAQAAPVSPTPSVGAPSTDLDRVGAEASPALAASPIDHSQDDGKSIPVPNRGSASAEPPAAQNVPQQPMHAQRSNDASNAPTPASSNESRPRSSSGLGRLLLLGVAVAASVLFFKEINLDHLVPRPFPAPPAPTPDVGGEWVSAWEHARDVTTPASAPDQSSVMLANLGVAPTGFSGFGLPRDQADRLVQTSFLQSQYDPNAHKGVDPSQFGASALVSPSANLSSSEELPAGYMIPNWDALPVRNQGERGTCAAFTGVAATEYAWLRQHPGAVDPDLSEQRFYWMAKPNCDSGNGCALEPGGSSYGMAFSISRSSSELNIPMEQDCPYDGRLVGNDTQIPQAATCANGVVKVEDTRRFLSYQDVARFMVKTGLPVAIGVPIQDHFFEPDSGGIIRELGDTDRHRSMHNGGHAFLLVGYKKLPDMPEEGGMCFVVRNSWGTFWGQGGYGCATLRWLESQERSTPGLTAVTRVRDGANVPQPEPAPPPPEDASALAVQSPQGGWAAGTWATSGAGGSFRLALARGGLSGGLELVLDGARLLYGGSVVGEKQSDGTTFLCSGRYLRACALELRESDGALRISPRVGQPQHALGQSLQASAVPWMTLGPIPDGRLLQAQVDPTARTVRCRLAGVDGAGPELVLALKGTEIMLGGKAIGSVDPSGPGLCTGRWRDACGVVLSSDGLDVVGW